MAFFCFFSPLNFQKLEHFIGFGGIWMPLRLPLSLLLLDCCCDGLLHCRRRVRTRYGRWKHHRAQAGNHLPGRTPAGGSKLRTLVPHLQRALCLRPSPPRCWQVKAATGEEVSAEDLGGADLHCKYDLSVSGRAGCRLQTLSNVFKAN